MLDLQYHRNVDTEAFFKRVWWECMPNKDRLNNFGIQKYSKQSKAEIVMIKFTDIFQNFMTKRKIFPPMFP